MLKRVLNASRFLVLAAVLGALAGAAALFIYGLVDTAVVISRTIVTGEVSTVGAKQLMLYFIEIFVLFLLGTVMLIMALSLYELFDSDLKLPARLEIRTFEDLKSNLVRVVIVVMTVMFLGQNRLLERRGGALRLRRGGGARDRCAELQPLDCKAG
jgi:uncharacterized membrane protein YqhA